MFNRIRHLLRSKRAVFTSLCRANNLQLDYATNKSEVRVLQDIFEEREYADYFPFYREVTVVDIGAHYGYFSLFAAANTASSSRIIALEPNASNLMRLEQNLADNRTTNVEVYPFAIGGENGEVDLFSGKDSNHSIVGEYLLVERKGAALKVRVKTLERLFVEQDIDHIDFLKIDCEGAEYAIFETMPGHVFDRITTISMEFHDLKDERFTAEVLIRKLKEHDFEIVKYVYGKTTMNLNYGRLVATKGV